MEEYSSSFQRFLQTQQSAPKDLSNGVSEYEIQVELFRLFKNRIIFLKRDKRKLIIPPPELFNYDERLLWESCIKENVDFRDVKGIDHSRIRDIMDYYKRQINKKGE